jgi:hypothetical protein
VATPALGVEFKEEAEAEEARTTTSLLKTEEEAAAGWLARTAASLRVATEVSAGAAVEPVPQILQFTVSAGMEALAEVGAALGVTILIRGQPPSMAEMEVSAAAAVGRAGSEALEAVHLLRET